MIKNYKCIIIFLYVDFTSTGDEDYQTFEGIDFYFNEWDLPIQIEPSIITATDCNAYAEKIIDTNGNVSNKLSKIAYSNDAITYGDGFSQTKNETIGDLNFLDCSAEEYEGLFTANSNSRQDRIYNFSGSPEDKNTEIDADIINQFDLDDLINHIFDSQMTTVLNDNNNLNNKLIKEINAEEFENSNPEMDGSTNCQTIKIKYPTDFVDTGSTSSDVFNIFKIQSCFLDNATWVNDTIIETENHKDREIVSDCFESDINAGGEKMKCFEECYKNHHYNDIKNTITQDDRQECLTYLSKKRKRKDDHVYHKKIIEDKLNPINSKDNYVDLGNTKINQFNNSVESEIGLIISDEILSVGSVENATKDASEDEVENERTKFFYDLLQKESLDELLKKHKNLETLTENQKTEVNVESYKFSFNTYWYKHNDSKKSVSFEDTNNPCKKFFIEPFIKKALESYVKTIISAVAELDMYLEKIEIDINYKMSAIRHENTNKEPQETSGANIVCDEKPKKSFHCKHGPFLFEYSGKQTLAAFKKNSSNHVSVKCEIFELKYADMHKKISKETNSVKKISPEILKFKNYKTNTCIHSNVIRYFKCQNVELERTIYSLFDFYCENGFRSDFECIIKYEKFKHINNFYELPKFLDLIFETNWDTKTEYLCDLTQILDSFLSLSKEFYKEKCFDYYKVENFLKNSRFHILKTLQLAYNKSVTFAFYSHIMIMIQKQKRSANLLQKIILYFAFFNVETEYQDFSKLLFFYNYQYNLIHVNRIDFSTGVHNNPFSKYFFDKAMRDDFIESFNIYITRLFENCQIEIDECEQISFYKFFSHNTFIIQYIDEENAFVYDLGCFRNFIFECMQLYYITIKYRYNRNQI